MATGFPSAATTGPEYSLGPAGVVIAADPRAARDAADGLAAAGVRLLHSATFAEARAGLGALMRADILVVEAAGATPEMLDAALGQIEALAHAADSALVVTIDPSQIDQVAAQLFGTDAQLLCDPRPAERAAAIVIARARSRGTLHDATRDAEGDRLQRLNEEVARIADTLARLTRGEEQDRRASVRDTGSGYRGQAADPAPDVSATEIRAVIRARRLRGQFFEGELFADPAWDMLLDLFASELERRRVSVSSLCIAAAVPPTTALRWIGTMHDAGLFERHADPSDRRRAYIALSDKGMSGMRSFAGALKRQGLPLV